MEKLIWDVRDFDAAKKMGAIPGFEGKWRFFSNFWTARVQMYGQSFPTVEHAYAAAKHPLAGTPEGRAEMARFAALDTPGQAKRMGGALTLRPDWELPRPDGLLLKEFVLLTLVRRKFHGHPSLAAQLLESGDRMIFEGNKWGDRTWGVIETKAGLEGFNRMGSILMCVRAELGGAGVPDWVPAAMPRYEGRGL